MSGLVLQRKDGEYRFNQRHELIRFLAIHFNEAAPIKSLPYLSKHY